LCAASFAATLDAADLSCAAHFDGSAVRAHVRFSNGSGVIGAGYAPREGRGIGAFVTDHPESLTALRAVLAAEPTDSYLSCSYNALHTYLFGSADGTATPGRYHLDPAGGVATISHEEAQRRDDNHLKNDLAARLAHPAAVFVLSASLAHGEDPLDDPTVAWPDDRERVVLGHVRITDLASDRERDGDVLVFDPTRVTDGIRLSNDPILRFRRAAYAASVWRRSGQRLHSDPR
jgi:catalase